MFTVLSVLVIILISMIVGRVATTALVLTGLSHEQARFQARSALTGAGFTTTESESIVTHPVRRRIIMVLMLTGSAGIVSVIGTIALGATEAQTPDDQFRAVLSLVVGIFLLLRLMRWKPVDRLLSRAIRRGLQRWTDLEVRDVEALLDIHGGYAIAELLVEPEDWVCDLTLAEARLNDEGILVLGVNHPNGGYDGAPMGDTVVRAGDTLTLYGHQDRIEELDDRVKGPLGDAEHARSRREMAQSRPVHPADDADHADHADHADGTAGPTDPGPEGTPDTTRSTP